MKITRLKEVCIIVEPDFGFAPPEQWERMAENTLHQVKRHIDYWSAHIERKTETICSHCGLTWEEDESGEPVCCGKAQEEWNEKIKCEIMAETNGPPESIEPMQGGK